MRVIFTLIILYHIMAKKQVIKESSVDTGVLEQELPIRKTKGR